MGRRSKSTYKVAQAPRACYVRTPQVMLEARRASHATQVACPSELGCVRNGASGAAPGLTATGDLATMTAEAELLEQVGNGFADRYHADFHLTIRRRTADAAGEAKRLGETVVQVDLDDALRAGLGEGTGAAPHYALGIEAHRHRRRARAVGREDLSDDVEQQVHFELDAHEVGRVRRVLIGLLDGAELIERFPRLQQPGIALHVRGRRIAVDTVRQRAPGEWQHILEGELVVEHYRVGGIEHSLLRARAPPRASLTLWRRPRVWPSQPEGSPRRSGSRAADHTCRRASRGSRALRYGSTGGRYSR